MASNETTIKIFYSDTANGLIKDSEILKVIFTNLGFEVELCAISSFKNKKESILSRIFSAILFRFKGLFFFKKYFYRKYTENYLIVLHLENIFLSALKIPAKHVLIPNQEWFDVSGIKFLPYIDVVWCKSQLALNIFHEHNVKCKLIGFFSGFSDDVARRCVAKKSVFLSRVGNSNLRGVGELVNAWSKHPEWPVLTIVAPPSRRVIPSPENVVYIDGFPSHNAYRDFAASFKFQIFATKTEGFGHSIFEALDVGSVVLVTNAPPMNEWFSSSNSLLIEATYCGSHKLSPLFSVTNEGIEMAVNQALTLSRKEIEVYQKNGYGLLGEMRSTFINNIKSHISQLYINDN